LDEVSLREYLVRLVSFAAFVLCGCYVNTPLVTTVPEPGTRLHVQLTDDGAQSLARYLGPNVAYIDGRLIQRQDSGMTLSVNSTTARTGEQQSWKGENVQIPKSAVATVEQKKVSKWRTALVAGVVVAGVAVISGVSGGSSGSSHGGGGGGSNQ
jgi:hypothetical protein